MSRFCVLCLGMPLLLLGCNGFRAEEPPPDIEPPPGAETPEAVVENTPAPPAAKRTVDDEVRELLKDAEAALAADRLTTPVHDNAFDRFQAVLLLRPHNQQARSGLQQITVRYAAMIRRALARNQPEAARALAERAKLVDRDHPLLAELNAEIIVVQGHLAARENALAGNADKEVLLNIQDLEQRNEALIEQLKSLAAQVRETEKSLLIVARDDAEGRWIYQRMSEGAPGYRLRGDIRLGRVPKILLLPPFE
jgi:hypothetical protein